MAVSVRRAVSEVALCFEWKGRAAAVSGPSRGVLGCSSAATKLVLSKVDRVNGLVDPHGSGGIVADGVRLMPIHDGHRLALTAVLGVGCRKRMLMSDADLQVPLLLVPDTMALTGEGDFGWPEPVGRPFLNWRHEHRYRSGLVRFVPVTLAAGEGPQ